MFFLEHGMSRPPGWGPKFRLQDTALKGYGGSQTAHRISHSGVRPVSHMEIFCTICHLSVIKSPVSYIVPTSFGYPIRMFSHTTSALTRSFQGSSGEIAGGLLPFFNRSEDSGGARSWGARAGGVIPSRVGRCMSCRC